MALLVRARVCAAIFLLLQLDSACAYYSFHDTCGRSREITFASLYHAQHKIDWFSSSFLVVLLYAYGLRLLFVALMFVDLRPVPVLHKNAVVWVIIEMKIALANGMDTTEMANRTRTPRKPNWSSNWMSYNMLIFFFYPNDLRDENPFIHFAFEHNNFGNDCDWITNTHTKYSLPAPYNPNTGSCSKNQIILPKKKGKEERYRFSSYFLHQFDPLFSTK